MANAWLSPTGYEDPESAWVNEPWAYDDDTYYPASNDFLAHGAQFLNLLHAVLSCTKVRVWVSGDHCTVDSVDIDVYDNGDLTWHHVYEGAIAVGEWVEKVLDTQRNITKLRLKAQCTQTAPAPLFYFHEADFWEAVGIQDKSANMATQMIAVGAL
ncbi:hypothetical protein ES707_03853 [subsurface metagenome]